MLIKTFFILLSSYFCAKAIVFLDIVSLGIFIILVFIPFFLVFFNTYFLGFILLRSSFDAIEKYQLPLPNPNMPIAGFLIVISWLILILNKNNLNIVLKNRFLKKFNFLSFLFLTVTFVSIIVSKTFSVYSLSDFSRLLSIILLVNYSVVYINTVKNGDEKLINFIIFSSIIPVSVSLYQLLQMKGLYMEGVNRIFGSFIHPNVFAEYLVVIFFVMIYKITSLKGFPKKILLSKIYLILITVLILNTYTRNVWIALFLVTCVYLTMGRNIIEKLKIYFLILIGIVLSLPITANRFLDLVTPASGNESSWGWRLKLWEKTFEKVHENPFFGHGLGMFHQDISVMAHNDYLRLAYEIGFIGLFFYLLLMGLILFMSYRKFINIKNNSIERRKGLITFCLFLTMLIISFADNLNRSTVVLSYAFVISAVFLSKFSNTKKYESINYK